jgi:hypothetical protein
VNVRQFLTNLDVSECHQTFSTLCLVSWTEHRYLDELVVGLNAFVKVLDCLFLIPIWTNGKLTYNLARHSVNELD